MSWVLIGSVVVLALYLVYRKFFSFKLLPNIPGPKPHWLFGNHDIMSESRRTRTNHLIMLRCHRQFGRVFQLVFPGRNAIMVSDADLAREVLDTKGTGMSQGFTNAFGRLTLGLLALKGDIWRKHRSFASKSFSSRTYEGVIDTTNEYLTKMTKNWDLAAEKGESLDVGKEFVNLASSVLSKVVLGTDPAKKDLTKTFKDVIQRCFRRSLYPVFIWNYFFRDRKQFNSEISEIRETLADLTATRRKDMETQGANDTLLDAMLQQSKFDSFSDKEILDEVIMFYFAGYETSSNALAFSLYLLAQHPEIVEKMREEVIGVCGQHANITLQNVNDLEYIDMVIKEVLRLYSPAPRVARELEENTVIGGREYQKHTIFVVQIYSIHHDEEYWENPEVFNPDRFKSTPKPGTYLPFGQGIRSCIGTKFAMTEMKLALADLVRKYTFRLDNSKQIQIQCGITLGFDPTSGIHVFLQRRKE